MNFDYTPNLQDVLCLKENKVHIWSAHFPDSVKAIPYLLSLLSKDEFQKVKDFRFPETQESFIISRGILRCLLGKYLEKSPRDIEIIYGLLGKPYALTKQSLYFNISHSRDYVLCALTKNCEIGIDIEYIDSNLDLEGMALSILSPQELTYWKNVNPEDRVDTFFKFWVCKEAFLKASGKGWLSDQLTIPFEESDVFRKVKSNDELNERMISPYYFKIIPGYASALFIEGPFLHPVYYIWSSNRLQK